MDALTVLCFCSGLVSTELKVSSVGPTGSGFQKAWDDNKEECMQSMARVLRVANTRFAAALLLAIGVCDAEPMMSQTMPLFAKAQLLARGSGRSPQ